MVQLVTMDLQDVTLEYYSDLSSFLLLKIILFLNNKYMVLFQKSLKSLKESRGRCNVHDVVLRDSFFLKISEICLVLSTLLLTLKVANYLGQLVLDHLNHKLLVSTYNKRILKTVYSELLETASSLTKNDGEVYV